LVNYIKKFMVNIKNKSFVVHYFDVLSGYK